MKGRLFSFGVFLFAISIRFEAVAGEFCLDTMRDIQARFAALDLNSGIGQRGYLANDHQIPLTLEARVAALSVGLNFWYVAFLPFPDEAAMLAHSKKHFDPLIPPFYLKGTGPLDPSQNPAETFRSLASQGVYWINDGKVLEVPPESLQVFLPEAMAFRTLPYGDGTGLFQEGWVFPKWRGVNDHQDIEASSRGFRKQTRRFLRQGYQVRFNTAFEESILAVAKQERGGATTRYNTKYLNMLRQLYKAGFAFSTEVWSPTGKLVAGEVCLRYENIVKADSIFHSGNIELAKMASLATMDRLHDAGIQLIDTGMVTDYSKSLSAKLIRGSDFLVRMKSEIQRSGPVAGLEPGQPWQLGWNWIENQRAYTPEFLAARTINRARAKALMPTILRFAKIPKDNLP